MVFICLTFVWASVFVKNYVFSIRSIFVSLNLFQVIAVLISKSAKHFSHPCNLFDFETVLDCLYHRDV